MSWETVRVNRRRSCGNSTKDESAWSNSPHFELPRIFPSHPAIPDCPVADGHTMELIRTVVLSVSRRSRLHGLAPMSKPTLRVDFLLRMSWPGTIRFENSVAHAQQHRIVNFWSTEFTSTGPGGTFVSDAAEHPSPPLPPAALRRGLSERKRESDRHDRGLPCHVGQRTMADALGPLPWCHPSADRHQVVPSCVCI